MSASAGGRFPTLHLPLSQLQAKYDNVVIGSGYGGGICSLRLCEAGEKSVCVLERGREWHPGSFPEDFTSALSAVRLTATKGDCVEKLTTAVRKEDGLFDIRVFNEVCLYFVCFVCFVSFLFCCRFW